MNRSSHPAKAARQTRAPFTLPELLTVITVLCVLAALLLPALGRAKFCARVALCVNNLSQCAQMTFLYASDNSGKLYYAYIDRPTVIFWSNQPPPYHADLRQTLLEYATTNRVLFCPAAPWPPPAEGKFSEFSNGGGTEYRIGYALWAGMRDTHRGWWV